MKSIIGWTSVLRSNVEESPETLRALEIIQRNAGTLVRLIEGRADSSTRSHSGLGLGLAIVRSWSEKR